MAKKNSKKKNGKKEKKGKNSKSSKEENKSSKNKKKKQVQYGTKPIDDKILADVKENYLPEYKVKVANKAYRHKKKHPHDKHKGNYEAPKRGIETRFTYDKGWSGIEAKVQAEEVDHDKERERLLSLYKSTRTPTRFQRILEALKLPIYGLENFINMVSGNGKVKRNNSKILSMATHPSEDITIFIHGDEQNGASSGLAMQKYYAKLGRKMLVVNYNCYRGINKQVASVAKQIIAYHKALHKTTKHDMLQKAKFMVVAHSNGGYVARGLEQSTAAQYIKEIVTSQTPHYGMGKKSRSVLNFMTKKHQKKGSAFLERINSYRSKLVKFTVGGRYDRIVPDDTGLNQSRVCNEPVVNTGHFGGIHNRGTFELYNTLTCRDMSRSNVGDPERTVRTYALEPGMTMRNQHKKAA